MDAFDTYLVLTFVGETRILAINADDELDEADIQDFDGDTQVRLRLNPRPSCVLRSLPLLYSELWQRSMT